MKSSDHIEPLTGKGAFFYIGAVTINENNNPILGKPQEELTRKVFATVITHSYFFSYFD